MHQEPLPNLAYILAERSVPRYTSYPTAPHFTPAVDSMMYESWLAALPVSAEISLYIHVPYCERLCLYCGCHTKATRRRNPIEAYADRLIAEARLIASRSGSGKIQRIHWGGGTPSILGEACLQRLGNILVNLFDTGAVCEHAIELDPRYVTASLADALARMGVNRASLGVQDLSPHVQDAIGRIQPFTTIRHAVDLLRAAGIQRINLDHMYGLPKQTTEDLNRSIGLSLSLDPQRFALFGYAHVPWFKPHQRLIDEASLPGPLLRLEQAQAARQQIMAAGYEAVGLDHFAAPDDDLAVAARQGTLHRNFQGYTTDAADAVIGIGASAIGRMPQGYAQNASDLAGYGRAIDAGRLATSKGVAVSPEDRLRGHIIERLMCDFQVDLDMLRPAADRGARFAAELDRLADLEAIGIVESSADRIRITDKGRPFARLVAAAFDGYLNSTKAQHSAAV